MGVREERTLLQDKYVHQTLHAVAEHKRVNEGTSPSSAHPVPGQYICTAINFVVILV